MTTNLLKLKIPKNVIIPARLNDKLRKLEKIKNKKHRRPEECGFWQFTLNTPFIHEIRQSIIEMRAKYPEASPSGKMVVHNITSQDNVHKILNTYFNASSSAFKIHISFAYVFVNKTTGQVIANPPSTKYFFKKPQIINC